MTNAGISNPSGALTLVNGTSVQNRGAEGSQELLSNVQNKVNAMNEIDRQADRRLMNSMQRMTERQEEEIERATRERNSQEDREQLLRLQAAQTRINRVRERERELDAVRAQTRPMSVQRGLSDAEVERLVSQNQELLRRLQETEEYLNRTASQRAAQSSLDTLPVEMERLSIRTTPEVQENWQPRRRQAENVHEDVPERRSDTAESVIALLTQALEGLGQRSRHRPSVRAKDPPKFSGQRSDARNWLERYEAVAKSNAWLDQDKAEQVELCMIDSEKAYNWFRAEYSLRNVEVNWRVFVNKFKSTFLRDL